MNNTNLNKLYSVFKTRLESLCKKSMGNQSFMEKSLQIVLFISSLAILMIYSAHKVDQKVVQISKINESLKDLRSRHIDMRTKVTSLSKITRVSDEVKRLGLTNSIDAPFKIEKQN